MITLRTHLMILFGIVSVFLVTVFVLVNREQDYVNTAQRVIQKGYSNKITYVYKWKNKKGFPFYPDVSALSAVGFPLTDFVTLAESTLKDFVFVTAANGLFLKPSLEGIATIQRLFPRKKIIFYDLGLDPSHISQVCLGKKV